MLVVENILICVIIIFIIFEINIKKLFVLCYVVFLYIWCVFILNEIIRDIFGYVKCMCIK